MFRSLRLTLLIAAVAGASGSARAFSLLGPFATWETTALGYNVGGGTGGQALDIGGPMNLGEEYRWNIKTITYGFDKSFLDYFGQRGVDEVNKAARILNSLPPISRMSPTLSEFPLDARQLNFQANALGLLDLKTWTLGLLVEQMGLTYAERYTWTLRNRLVTPAPDTNYIVVMRNFDPVTWNPTPYVNGVLYTYSVVEFGPPLPYSDAVESVVDSAQLLTAFNTVAGIPSNGNVFPISSYFTSGVFFTGLTRDDVGGLRYIYRRKNVNVESLIPGTIGDGGGPWTTPGPGTTNAAVDTALRQGIEKVVFKPVKFFGIFLPVTNHYVDTYINSTNGHVVSQRVQRVLSQPDILFVAGDLGTFGISGQPVLLTRTDTTTWANLGNTNNLPSAGVEHDGPGVIEPAANGSVVIAFSNVGPFIINTFPGAIDQANQAGFFGGWAAFDGTTNAPFVFPNGASIQQLEQRILSILNPGT